MKAILLIAISVLIIGIILLTIRFLARKRARIIMRHKRRNLLAFWSIGCMESASPFNWVPDKATVLKPTDIAANMYIIADPFLFKYNNNIYLFFEAMFHNTSTAHIDCACFNREKHAWQLLGTILEESFHLSYPQVIEDNGTVYMIPESKQARQIRLYKSVDFPGKWEFVKPLVENKKLVDATIIKHDNHWYLFASRKKKLYLYHAEKIEGPWQFHPKNPVRRGNFSRCGGRIIKYKNKLFRITQDQRGYGAGVYAMEIILLSQKKFKERYVKDINPILLPGSANWAETGMHHLDTIKIDARHYFGVFDGEQFPENSNNSNNVQIK